NRQHFVELCDDDWLVMHGRKYGLFPKPPTPAKGSLNFTGNGGAVIPEGTVLQDNEGREYKTLADLSLSSLGKGSVEVEALEPGTAGEQPAGAKLSLASPLAGADGDATVAAGGLSGAADAETFARYRDRILRRMRRPPGAGAYWDY